MRKPNPSSSRAPVTTFTTRFYRAGRACGKGRLPLGRSHLSQMRIEAVAAARLVETGRPYQHPVAAGDEPLRMVRGIAAHHADRQGLGDVLGDREQLRHRLEGTAQVILIETG